MLTRWIWFQRDFFMKYKSIRDGVAVIFFDAVFPVGVLNINGAPAVQDRPCTIARRTAKLVGRKGFPRENAWFSNSLKRGLFRSARYWNFGWRASSKDLERSGLWKDSSLVLPLQINGGLGDWSVWWVNRVLRGWREGRIRGCWYRYYRHHNLVSSKSWKGSDNTLTCPDAVVSALNILFTQLRRNSFACHVDNMSLICNQQSYVKWGITGASFVVEQCAIAVQTQLRINRFILSHGPWQLMAECSVSLQSFYYFSPTHSCISRGTV